MLRILKINQFVRNFSITSRLKSIKMNEQKKLVSICHMRSTNDKISNLKQVSDIIKLAKDKQSSFVFLPECCDFVGENRQETLQLSELVTGETVKAYQKLAKENNIWLSCGGVHETVVNPDLPDGSKQIYNSHIVINSDGNIVDIYRKLHMFDVDTPEFRFRESDVVKPGDEIVLPVHTPIGELGLQICYDLRFSEVSTILRKNGAQILTYPSAFSYSTGQAHWECLLRARAIENQCFVIAAAQHGFHNKKRQSYGHAMIIDPWGKVIAECDDNELNVKTVEIDLTKIDGIRNSMPCFNHRRSDVYNLDAIQPFNIKNHASKTMEHKFCFGGFEIPDGTIFYSSQHSIAFTNIRCVVPGHVLVSSKRPVERLKELKPYEINDFFQSVCKIQKMLENVYKTTSATVTIQDGENAGQTVKHLHCHIMPRRLGDFEMNDQIYIELNKHDSEGVETPRRSDDKRIAEAEIYRNEFEKSK